MALKAKDIRNMTAAEINQKISAVKDELFKLRFEQKTGRVEKPHRIKEAKKEIARCFTVLKEIENASR